MHSKPVDDEQPFEGILHRVAEPVDIEPGATGSRLNAVWQASVASRRRSSLDSDRSTASTPSRPQRHCASVRCGGGGPVQAQGQQSGALGGQSRRGAAQGTSAAVTDPPGIGQSTVEHAGATPIGGALPSR